MAPPIERFIRALYLSAELPPNLGDSLGGFGHFLVGPDRWRASIGATFVFGAHWSFGGGGDAERTVGK